jgi:hypothetical protein
MASLTLAEAALLQQNPLISGVIESIVTTNQMYRVLPFQQIDGNALSYNRELSLGDSQFIGIGGGQNTITAKTGTKVAPATAKIVPIVGDAEVDHFEANSMSSQNDQKAIQIAGKAKSIGRKYQDTMINGDIAVDTKSFDGLAKLVPAGQKVVAAGAAFSLEVLDALIDGVKSKDGQVDYFMMNSRHVRNYLSVLRALGGAGISEVVQLPGGASVMAYRGVPIFKNDWIAVDATTEPALNRSDIYAGVFDDGSKKVGMAGITSAMNSGIFVTDVGEKEDSNDLITRVRFYCGFALFSELGIAMAPQVDDPA